jgi:hypothetical protein
MKKIIAAMLVAIIAWLPTKAAADGEHGQGARNEPCVDNYEFWHAPFHLSRHEVEVYFNTVGKGMQLDYTDDGKDKTWWSYRWCGKVPKGVELRFIQVGFEPGEGSVWYKRAVIVGVYGDQPIDIEFRHAATR